MRPEPLSALALLVASDPVLAALKARLREGRARMPAQTAEEAYAQQARSLTGQRGPVSP